MRVVRALGRGGGARCRRSRSSTSGWRAWRCARGGCRRGQALLILHRIQASEARSNLIANIGRSDGARTESRRRVSAGGRRTGSARSGSRGARGSYSRCACGSADCASNDVRGWRCCGGCCMLERRCEVVCGQRGTARSRRRRIRLAVAVGCCSCVRACCSIPCARRLSGCGGGNGRRFDDASAHARAAARPAARHSRGDTVTTLHRRRERGAGENEHTEGVMSSRRVAGLVALAAFER